MKKLLVSILSVLIALALAMPIVAEGEVAKVGDTTYSTIQEAVNAIVDGSVSGTIEVVADTEENVTIPENANISININDGITVTGGSSKDDANKSHTFKNGGTLTITGSGNVVNNQSGSAAFYNEPGATAILDGNKYSGNTWYVIKNLGNLTINKITMEQSDAGSSAIANGWYGDDGSDCGEEYPTDGSLAYLEINDGTFSGGMNIVKNDDCSDLLIKGGTFTNTDGPTVLNWNKAKIEGGTFESTKADSSVIANGVLDNTGGKDIGQLEITGGEFVASDGKGLIFKYGAGSQGTGTVTISGGSFKGNITISDDYPYTPSISGGTFSSDPSAYVAQDQAQANLGDGTNASTYAVGKTSIQELAQNATSGQTLTVTKGSVELTNVPEGVKVTNDANNTGTVKVNGTSVKAGETIEAPAQPTQGGNTGSTTRPSRPSSPSKDLPSNTEECQKEFGKDYIYSKDLDACIIKYLVVDTSTK